MLFSAPATRSARGADGAVPDAPAPGCREVPSAEAEQHTCRASVSVRVRLPTGVRRCCDEHPGTRVDERPPQALSGSGAALGVGIGGLTGPREWGEGRTQGLH